MGQLYLSLLTFSDSVISDYLDFLEQQDGAPFVFNTSIYSAVSNIVTSMVLGKQFPFNDPEMLTFRENLNTFIQQSTNPKWMILDVFPVLRKLFPFLSNVRTVNGSINIMDQYLERHLADIKKNLASKDGVVSSFAEKMFTLTTSSDSDHVPLLDDHDLKMMVFDMLAAGFMTTSSALTALMLVILNKPEVEAKVCI